MTRRRLILYLLLNVFLSALVTGTILFLYDRYGRKDCPPLAGPSSGVTVLGVSGMGDLASEMLILENKSEVAAVLTGWVIRTSDGASFTFPHLTLFPGGRVQVHSTKGEASITDLYWGSGQPLWRSGMLVVLYDTQNLARAYYRIP